MTKHLNLPSHLSKYHMLRTCNKCYNSEDYSITRWKPEIEFNSSLGHLIGQPMERVGNSALKKKGELSFIFKINERIHIKYLALCLAYSKNSLCINFITYIVIIYHTGKKSIKLHYNQKKDSPNLCKIWSECAEGGPTLWVPRFKCY